MGQCDGFLARDASRRTSERSFVASFLSFEFSAVSVSSRNCWASLRREASSVSPFSTSSRQIKSFAGALIASQDGDGKLYSARWMILKSLVVFSCWNGGKPHRSTYRITPSDHMSTAAV